VHHRKKLDFEDSTTVIANILDSLDLALISVDAQRRVRFMNRLAESLLGANGPLSVRHGRIRCSDAQVAAKLDKVLTAARGETMQVTSAASIAIPYDHRCRYVTALPFGIRGGFGSSRTRVLLTITDANVRPKSREKALSGLFGLTPAEIRVAMLLLSGLEPKEISHSTGATLNTVRFQLKTIYRKTQTTRQSQLVRLISMLPGQLEGVPKRQRITQPVARRSNHVPIRCTREQPLKISHLGDAMPSRRLLKFLS
jgi:DNA-binding CsgD family transcriptional regulator